MLLLMLLQLQKMGERTNHFGAWLATVAMVGHVATPITTAAAAPNTFCPAARPVKRSLVSVIMRSYPTKYCSQPRPVSVSTSSFPIPHHRLHWVQINTLASCLGLQRDLVIVSPFLSSLFLHIIVVVSRHEQQQQQQLRAANKSFESFPPPWLNMRNYERGFWLQLPPFVAVAIKAGQQHPIHTQVELAFKFHLVVSLRKLSTETIAVKAVRVQHFG
ncbi:hypothetical protein ACLKA6_006667 [Drosophila palustris]